MSIFVIEGPFGAFAKELYQSDFAKMILAAKPFCAVQPMPQQLVVGQLENDVLYIQINYHLSPPALNYAGVNPVSGQIFKGILCVEDCSGLKNIVIKNANMPNVLAQLEAPECFRQILNALIKTEDAAPFARRINESYQAYRDLILCDIRRIYISLMKTTEEVECFARGWLEGPLPSKNAYVQGDIDDAIFMLLFNSAWTSYWLDACDIGGDAEQARILSGRDFRNNLLACRFVYLAARSAGVQEPAAFSAWCRKDSPDLWMLSWVNPRRDVDQRRRTLVMPDYLVPPAFLAAIRSGETSFTLTTYDRFEDCPLSSLGNRDVESIVSLLFGGDSCYQSRFGVLESKHEMGCVVYQDELTRHMIAPADSQYGIPIKYCDISGLIETLKAKDCSRDLRIMGSMKLALAKCADDANIKSLLLSAQSLVSDFQARQGESLPMGFFAFQVRQPEDQLNQPSKLLREIIQSVSTLTSKDQDIVSRKRAMTKVQIYYALWYERMAAHPEWHCVLVLLTYLKEFLLPWVLEITLAGYDSTVKQIFNEAMYPVEERVSLASPVSWRNSANRSDSSVNFLPMSRSESADLQVGSGDDPHAIQAAGSRRRASF